MNKISSIMPCLFVVSATSSTLAAEPYAKLDASTCRPKTIVASDFRFNRDSRRKEDVIAELPDAVWEKFVLAANDVISRLSDDDLKYFHCPDLMPAAFRIALANKLDLYVARIDGRHGGSFHFVLHDPKTGSASQESYSTDAEYSEGLDDAPKDFNGRYVTKPLVHLTKLHENSASQLVIEEVAHRQTVYNGILYH